MCAAMLKPFVRSFIKLTSRAKIPKLAKHKSQKHIMTNKHASKQHGLVNNKRPKSKLRKRTNKANARARRAANPVVRKVTA